MKERDTKIIPVRAKITLSDAVDQRVIKLGVSRNSWIIRAINEALRPHKRRH